MRREPFPATSAILACCIVLLGLTSCECCKPAAKDGHGPAITGDSAKNPVADTGYTTSTATAAKHERRMFSRQQKRSAAAANMADEASRPKPKPKPGARRQPDPTGAFSAPDAPAPPDGPDEEEAPPLSVPDPKIID